MPATYTPTPTNTNTPTPEPPTDTPTPTPVPPCYLYVVSADDGTSNRNAYSFSYVTCNGTTTNSSVLNLNERTVCAREGSVTSASPYIGAEENGAICGSDPTQIPTVTPTNTPTPTPLPPTDTPTPTPSPTPTNTPSPTPDPNFYYLAERYECQEDGTCLYIEDLLIANNIALTIAPTQRYRLDPTSGYILRVMTGSPSGIALLTTMSGGGQITCSNLCTQPATYTPTPTNTNTPTPLPPTDTPTPSPTPCPSEGTFLGGTCDGYNLYYRTANGSCGYVDTFIESNSASCGYMTPTPTATPSLPDGVLDFGSSDSNYQQCGGGYEPNDYEYDRTYYVNFTSPRSSYGYVLVYLNDNSPIQLPFSQNDTSAYLTVPCGCGSECASIQYVMNIIYSTPTPTPEPLPATNTPEPTNEGGGGEVPFSP